MTPVEFIEEMATVAHVLCKTDEHEFTQHIPTCTVYAKALYGYGYTPEEIINTIWELGNVDGKWQGHPHPDKVLEVLAEW